MRLLAIETSTLLGGAAIMESESGLLVESRLNVRVVAHSERLMPEIDACLKRAGLSIGDIDCFAAASGPGSFTGLRIGLSTLKGLAYATGKPVVTVPTLEAMAWNLPFCPHPVCPLLDARKKEVYAGAFVWEEDGFRRLMPESSIKISDIALTAGGRASPSLEDFEKVVFLGEGALLYRNEILGLFGKRAVFAPAHLSVPMPSSTAHLGLKKALRGEFDDPASLGPCYIRKSEAEIKFR